MTAPNAADVKRDQILHAAAKVFAERGYHAIGARHAGHPDGAAGHPADPVARLANPYLLTSTLYLALLFAPSGIWLLWGFPDWETMQVARDHAALPAWLVACFAVTNISQGVLGF